MAMVQLLASIFGRIGQPRVIAEIIGGVFLGPSVMGRIPGYTQAIFNPDALVGLTLTANIGLVLYLFIIGVEIDGNVIKKNFKPPASSFPLALALLSVLPSTNEYPPPSGSFGVFLLFTAVAVGITAFPVLCRILTATKLLETTVGTVTLAAGVGNDVVGWILLALTVALVNASSGVIAVYVLLVAVGYTIFLLFPVRLAYRWLAMRTGSLEEGTPSTFMMTITILLVFVSAFFTDIIGIHPIFGGFLAGLIIPHTNGYGIAVTEKIEDLVTILFLPLYFALSGLSTNLGLLNDRTSWGYVFLICAVAFVSKFAACSVTAKVSGFNIRESGAIGSLMSCKGLVELIVLNIGLAANVLSVKTFSMFVVHAIFLTFMTTPLVNLFYPPKHRTRIGDDELGPKTTPRSSTEQDGEELTNRFALVLDQIEQLPAAMTVTQLLCPAASNESIGPSSVPSLDEKTLATVPSLATVPYQTPSVPPQSPISLTLFRLVELSNRTSAVLKSHLIHADPVWLQTTQIKSRGRYCSKDQFSSTVANRLAEDGAGMIVIPWASGNATEDGETYRVRNPFDGVFHSSESQDQIMSSVVYSEFIRNVFLTAPCDVSVFVDRGLSSPAASGVGQNTLLILPFFGGPDDRLALRALVKICSGNKGIRALAVRLSKTDTSDDDSLDKKQNLEVFIHNTIAGADTVYGNLNTHTRLASDTADNLIWERYASPSADPSLASALSQITFSTIKSPKPLQSVVEFFSGVEVQRTGRNHIVAVLGRSRRMAVERLDGELQSLMSQRNISMGSAVRKTLGDVGAALVTTSVNASLLVVQTCVTSL
ncbi:Sodium/hydrogen exchanger family-domain-containing protein [Rhodocollybia butyracea]|uniref:Sodium/hydrogen exchanger family-domain-containing protein n=1 Tax=Rhodocollybia butyracea TaxID=206335 RepID=A0A9P5PQN2_9AGAR|nr:Sodium/hydrogen exchanger family-domain-containing protein [Rhodocollybia butyracea]